MIGLDEVLERLDEHDSMFAKLLKMMEKHSGEIIKLREDMVAGFKRHDEEIAKLREIGRGFEVVNRHFSALGARWGLMMRMLLGRG